MAQKYYHSGLSGAPVLSGTAGSLITVLDAVLKDGWGQLTATSVVVSGGVATATFASAHAAEEDITVRVAGATPSGLNGDWMVTARAGNTISWATGLADGTATGTITVKIAPLDFTKPFSGTNKAGYRSSSIEGTGFYLRFDDSGAGSAMYARVVGYESMTDVDTGTAAFPTAVQMSGGMYLHKSAAANGNAIPWEIVGDEMGFYLVAAPFAATNSLYQGRCVYWFGDIKSYRAGDAYRCVVAAASSSSNNANNGHVGCTVAVTGASSYPSFVARSYTQVGGSVLGCRLSLMHTPNSSPVLVAGDGSSCLGTYPMGADNSLRVTPLLFAESPSNSATAAQLRGVFPGAYHPLLFIPGGTFGPRDAIVATGEMAGKKLLACPAYPSANALSLLAGGMFIDIKGAWR